MEDQIYSQVIMEVLRALRGKRSQHWLASKMGIQANTVSKWENQYRGITWSEFVQFCQALNVKQKKLKHWTFGLSLETNEKKAAQLLVADRPLSQVAPICQRTPSTVKRWMNGKTPLPLKETFILLNNIGRLSAFLESLLSIDKIPTLQNELSKHQKAKELFAKEPRCSLVMLFLNLDQYRKLKKHSDELLSNSLSLPVTLVKKIIKQLSSCGLIEQVDDKWQEATYYLNLAATGEKDFENALKIKSFWQAEAARFAKNNIATPERFTSGFDIYCCDDNIEEQILEEHRKFNARMREILSHDASGPIHSIYFHTFQFSRAVIDE